LKVSSSLLRQLSDPRRPPPPAPPPPKIGHTTDGGYGYGWKNDSGDTDEFPFNDALAQRLANEVG
jgi:hypothetical protein